MTTQPDQQPLISLNDETQGQHADPFAVSGDPAAPATDVLSFQPFPTQAKTPSVPGTPTPPTSGTTSFSTSQDGDSIGQKIVAEAMKYVGVPYVYGGNGPTQFDCSGLTKWAYGKAAGIDLPRISYQQFNDATRIKMSDLRPGDLVFWDDSDRNPGADHVAIYVGNGEIIEAPRPGKTVRVRKLGTWDQDQYAWGGRVKGVNGA